MTPLDNAVITDPATASADVAHRRRQAKGSLSRIERVLAVFGAGVVVLIAVQVVRALIS